MVSGSRSASSASSRRNRYNPGVEFMYRFDSNRTFSRDGKRPATSPSRLKTASRKQTNFQATIDDMKAAASSPSPSFLNESFGGSLVMLQKGYQKVHPEKFLELQKFSNRMTPVPLTSPRSQLSTPRLVKQMTERVKRETIIPGSVTEYASKETQYDYNCLDETMKRRLSDQNSTSNNWDVTDYDRSQVSQLQRSDFDERCVRCSEFPDIQIEGRSLSKILTNNNTTMAKEHCEVLGAKSCPDCVKIRSQKHHEENCLKNTPDTPNDVYKLVLIHEKVPYLTSREIRRKLLDGEISDDVLNVSRWPQLHTTIVKNDETVEDGEESHTEQTSFLPEKNETKNRTKKANLKSSKSFLQTGVPAFETIHETSESNEPGEDEKSLKQSVASFEETGKEIVFKQHDAEELHKIQVVPALEHSSTLESDDRQALNQKSVKKKSFKHKYDNQENTQKVEKSNQTDNAELCSSSHSTLRPMLQRRSFTFNVVPSSNFFFDIADLAQRIHRPVAGKREIKRNEASKFLQELSANISPPHENATEVNKSETDSVTSSDSVIPRDTIFNMSYEPPILFEKKGQHFAEKKPLVGN